MFGNTPLIQHFWRYRGIERFRQRHIQAALFKDFPGHGQGIIGRRYATVQGEHHADLDDLLWRDANIQGITDMGPDLRGGELEGGGGQGGHSTISDIEARTAPDGTVQTLRGDAVHIRSQLIGDGHRPLEEPALAPGQARPHL
jgi:hypothetical protein